MVQIAAFRVVQAKGVDLVVTGIRVRTLHRPLIVAHSARRVVQVALLAECDSLHPILAHLILSTTARMRDVDRIVDDFLRTLIQRIFRGCGRGRDRARGRARGRCSRRSRVVPVVHRRSALAVVSRRGCAAHVSVARRGTRFARPGSVASSTY